MSYEETPLWRRTLGDLAPSDHPEQLEQLRTLYRGMRSRADQLTKQIAASCPGLTVHDVTHLDGLWRTASLIAGSDYPINPLEGFIFGAAILLHDAAMSVAAFPGKLIDLKQTVEWQDTLASVLDRTERDRATPFELLPRDVQDEITFSVLRKIHADQAARLISTEFIGMDRRTWRVLEDPEMVRHYGSLISRIAASHNWPIGWLEEKMPRHVGAMPPWPAEWAVRPIKLACLLRCADAAHIDAERAPDFLMTLLRPRGISLQHWLGQNRLSQAIHDPLDPSALLITAPSSIPVEERAAWWVAFDAIQILQRELQDSDALLRDVQEPRFLVQRVSGANNPRALAEYIQAAGWSPVDVHVKAADVSKIIETLGGEALYGHRNLLVIIRELVQNAADAIRARRLRDEDGVTYEGRVTIIVRENPENSESILISVDDDGIGMSERVLTGPLLDFGTSFWTSDLIETEFPGLRSSSFRASGRFGVGFFSVFMLSRRVTVESRRYEVGLQDTLSLQFDDGARSRPFLTRGRRPGMGSSTSTRVTFAIEKTIYEATKKFHDHRKFSGDRLSDVTFSSLLAALFPTLDCDIYLKEMNSPTQRVHNRNWRAGDLRKWLGEIHFEETFGDEELSRALDEAADHLKPIVHNDNEIGLDAITYHPLGIPVRSISGISDQIGVRQFDAEAPVFGYLEAVPVRAARDRSELVAPKGSLAIWATAQASLLKVDHLGPFQRFKIAEAVAAWGGDARPIAIMWLNGELKTLDEIAEFFETHDQIIVPVHNLDGRLEITDISMRIGMGHYIGLTFSKHDFATPVVYSAGRNRTYNAIVDENNQIVPCGWFAIFDRILKERGIEYDAEFENNVVLGIYRGPSSELQGIASGQEIRHPALVLTTRKH